MKIARRRWWIYLLLFVLVMINYMDRTALSVAVGPIQKELNLSSTQVGLMLSAFLWSYLLFLIPSGILTDRFGPRVVNAVSIVVWSLATMLVGIVRGFGGLIGARLLMGVGESSTYPAAGRVLREWAPASERGRAASIYNSGAYAGPALGAILAAALITSFGWQTMFVIMGALGFIWLGAWLIWFRDPSKATWLSEPERAMILEERKVPGEQAQASKPKGGVLSLLRYRSMWGVALVQSAAVYTQYLFLTWLPGYLEQVHHLSIMKSGLFTAVPYVVAVLAGIGLGIVFDRRLKRHPQSTARRRYIVAACLLASSVVLLTPFFSDVTVILILISISMTCISTTVSMNLALLGDLLRSRHLAGRANSIAMIGGNTFGAAAPIVTGYIVDTTHSYNSAFVVAGIFLLAGVVVALTLPRHPIGEEESAHSDGFDDAIAAPVAQ